MKKSPKTAIIVAIVMFASQFMLGIYKIGIMDGKATKVALVEVEKVKK